MAWRGSGVRVPSAPLSSGAAQLVAAPTPWPMAWRGSGVRVPSAPPLIDRCSDPVGRACRDHASRRTLRLGWRGNLLITVSHVDLSTAIGAGLSVDQGWGFNRLQRRRVQRGLALSARAHVINAKAIANGDVVILGWDLDVWFLEGLLGFHIVRQYVDDADQVVEERPLASYVAFTGQSNPGWQPQNTTVWPVQKFTWRDLTL